MTEMLITDDDIVKLLTQSEGKTRLAMSKMSLETLMYFTEVVDRKNVFRFNMAYLRIQSKRFPEKFSKDQAEFRRLNVSKTRRDWDNWKVARYEDVIKRLKQWGELNREWFEVYREVQDHRNPERVLIKKRFAQIREFVDQGRRRTEKSPFGHTLSFSDKAKKIDARDITGLTEVELYEKWKVEGGHPRFTITFADTSREVTPVGISTKRSRFHHGNFTFTKLE